MKTRSREQEQGTTKRRTTTRATSNEYTKKKRNNEKKTKRTKEGWRRRHWVITKINRLVWAPSGQERSKKNSTSEMRVHIQRQRPKLRWGMTKEGTAYDDSLIKMKHEDICDRKSARAHTRWVHKRCIMKHEAREKFSQCKWGIVV